MVCRIADVLPLRQLRRDLGLRPTCHSPRKKCVLGHEPREGEYVFGLPGAVLGYCQALFAKDTSPGNHTSRVRSLLESIGAPWSSSHEIFWGHRGSLDVEGFLSSAIGPLCQNGRVPIVITGLDPATDADEVRELFSYAPPIYDGETVLVRMVLPTKQSFESAARLVLSLTASARDSHRMPSWWPLFQANSHLELWSYLESSLGDVYKYVNVAVNPFTNPLILRKLAPQITVAQLPIGSSDGISERGTITLPPGMKIADAVEEDSYCLNDFLLSLTNLPSIPTLILLGPSQENWTDDTNLARISKFLNVLRPACDDLWGDLPRADRESTWAMSH